MFPLEYLFLGTFFIVHCGFCLSFVPQASCLLVMVHLPKELLLHVLIVMSVPKPTITILEETAIPVIQDGEREAIFITVPRKPTPKACHTAAFCKKQAGFGGLFFYNPTSFEEVCIHLIAHCKKGKWKLTPKAQQATQ